MTKDKRPVMSNEEQVAHELMGTKWTADQTARRQLNTKNLPKSKGEFTREVYLGDGLMLRAGRRPRAKRDQFGQRRATEWFVRMPGRGTQPKWGFDTWDEVLDYVVERILKRIDFVMQYSSKCPTCGLPIENVHEDEGDKGTKVTRMCSDWEVGRDRRSVTLKGCGRVFEVSYL